MPVPILSRRRPVLDKQDLLTKAIEVARRPATMKDLPGPVRPQVEEVAKAIQLGSGWSTQGGVRGGFANTKGVSAAVVARRAAAHLDPSSSITPVDIAQALVSQGLDWIQPFPPGEPLVPYYGYTRRPRTYDYQVGRNITTETRPDRIPFATLLQLWKGYDVAQACTRYSINDLRSMRVRFEVMDGHEDNAVKEVTEAKRFLRRPDGYYPLSLWLAMNQRNVWIYDSAPIYRLRDKGGRLKHLMNFSAETLAPMLDYFGWFPESPAPAFQQFIQGIPWDWLSRDEVIYYPFWPETDSPYGTPPLETVLINANTDVRLQLYFLDFFTKGQVPEAFAMAPEDMTSPDDIADFQEQYNSETYGDQAERWGLRWLPHGTELNFYKPQTFTPDLAQYVMRRTIAAFGLTPQNLGILEDVNRASSDTQVDQQFRISTLPIVRYYEDLLDSVLQTDLTLPVQIRFDTGREKEDRLMEAQAHQIYWSIGAEKSSEIREKVLGYPIDPEQQAPLTVLDQRLGIIPMAHIIAISGEVDPLTGMPKPGSVKPIPYELPGGGTPVPAEGPQGGAPQPAAGAGPKARRDPTKAYPEPLALGKGASTEPLDDETPEEDSTPAKEGPGPEWVGYGRWGIPGGSSAQGVGATGGSLSVAEAEDLRRWQRQSRQRVGKGKSPRHFEGSAISPGRYTAIWSTLQNATSRERVDEAFAKAKGPVAAGIVVQAQDSGRVLMVRRTPDKHDDAEAYARWEFPGGKLTGDDPWTGALREWSEETGAQLRDAAHQGAWTSPDGSYVGYVVSVPSERSLHLSPTGEEVSEARWWDKSDLDTPVVRDKVTETLTRVRPLLKGWTGTPRDSRGRWSTPNRVAIEKFHRHTDRIIAHYQPLIQHAMAEHVTRDAVLKVARSAYAKVQKATTPRPRPPVTPAAAGIVAGAGVGGVGVGAAAGVGVAAGGAGVLGALQGVAVTGTVVGIVAVVSALYADAYMQGAHEAAQAATGSMPPWTVALPPVRDTWEPGTAQSILSSAGTSLVALLAQAGVVINGVDQTQLERIAQAIERGIEQGFDLATVEAEVAQIIDTADRAYMIAETEYMRAMAAAQMDVYRRNGVPMLQWLHEPGACHRCMENVAASPQPTANPHWPQGPIPVHPLTRCAVAPYYGPRR